MDFPYNVSGSKLKNVAWLLLSLVFVVAGMWMGGFWGWFCVIFFGLGGVVFGLQVFPNGSYLLLTERGFVIRSLFRERVYEWKECGPFSIQNLGGGRFVVFKFSAEYIDRSRTKRASSLVDLGALPGSYNLSLEELASKMNLARTVALRIGPATDECSDS